MTEVSKPFTSIKPKSTQRKTQQTKTLSTATHSLQRNNNMRASSISANVHKRYAERLCAKLQALHPIKPFHSF